MTILKAPFPYYGGKSRVAPLVWKHFGQVDNYVEPFFGSGAVLLQCPHPGHTETVNDADGLLCNFFRALQHDPEAVAAYADYPVSECDLHSRHRWLRDRRAAVEELMTDPDAYDAKVAGWWVWGISQWIGSGWCSPPGVADVRKLPHVGDAGMGVHRGSGHPSQQLPMLSGDSGATGRGVHSKRYSHKVQTLDGEVWRKRPSMESEGVHRKRPVLPGPAGGAAAECSRADDNTLIAYFDALAARLRRVRVCCGDWTRVLGPSVTWRHGVTAVFLDPPYALSERDSDLYAHDATDVFPAVRAWAIANGDNPLLRIAVCGYEDGVVWPDGWEAVRWKAPGGYGSQGNGRGRANAGRETIWFSPFCCKQPTLFDLVEETA